ncbi:GNAT family N-acetyltransferase [Szabonella alba]|uniref:N-acetyltransferase n=1 Tax=Szabonella alba TaxID=2804194 RepID=A0A8K0V932_9RHOB|nr:GNAT family N-acetyltransferase [Szabonella alba]MBL4917381.1 N-acetyltransferase [Szabonella alba]
MIRAAAAADGAAILRIWNPVIRYTAATFNNVEKTGDEIGELLAAKAGAGQPFLLAEEAGQVLGFATYGAFRGGVGYRRIAEHTILLDPSAHGRGLGRALMATLETVARGQDIASLMGGISGENTAGIAFHRALGFQEVGRIPQAGWKFGRWMDLVLMQKILSA